MKTRYLFLTMLMLAFMGLTFTSCDKDDDDDENNETNTETLALETITDDDVVEDFNNIVFSDAEEGEALISKPAKKGTGDGKFQTCATISTEKTEAGRSIVIDFGTEGCKGPRGHVKKGKMIITITGKWREENHSRKIVLEDFYINDHKIEGTRTVTTKKVALTSFEQTVKLEGGKVTLSDGTVLTHESTKTRKLEKGIATPWNRSDDEWEITGESSGVNYKQKAYTMKITTPLHRVHPSVCRFPEKGVKEYTIEDKKVVTDFGTEKCNTAKVTINGGEPKEIELGKRWKNQKPE